MPMAGQGCFIFSWSAGTASPVESVGRISRKRPCATRPGTWQRRLPADRNDTGLTACHYIIPLVLGSNKSVPLYRGANSTLQRPASDTPKKAGAASPDDHTPAELDGRRSSMVVALAPSDVSLLFGPSAMMGDRRYQRISPSSRHG